MLKVLVCSWCKCITFLLVCGISPPALSGEPYLAFVGFFIYMGFGLLAFDNLFGMVMSVLSAGLGWMSLIVLYRLVLLVFLCQDSCPGENKYGPSPKYVQEQG